MRHGLPYAFLCSFRYDDLNAHSITFRHSAMNSTLCSSKGALLQGIGDPILPASRGRRGGVLDTDRIWVGVTDRSVRSRLLGSVLMLAL